MTSDEKTVVPSLISLNKSDLFTLGNISSSITLKLPDDDTPQSWDIIVKYLPLDLFRIIESYEGIFTVEEFDPKYIHNPKMCAYERYGMTNMWRPLMILNRCPSIDKFNFKYIRFFDITKLTSVLSVLISRSLHD